MVWHGMLLSLSLSAGNLLALLTLCSGLLLRRHGGNSRLRQLELDGMNGMTCFCNTRASIRQLDLLVLR